MKNNKRNTPMDFVAPTPCTTPMLNKDDGIRIQTTRSDDLGAAASLLMTAGLNLPLCCSSAKAPGSGKEATNADVSMPGFTFASM